MIKVLFFFTEEGELWWVCWIDGFSGGGLCQMSL